jgi:His-Xaa-Ser system protein HxsD
MSSGDRAFPESPTMQSPTRTLQLVVDLRVYRLDAILKAGYRLANRFSLRVDELLSESKAIVVVTLPSSTPEAPEDILALFYRELADQELRERISEQTRDIRALLLAHAFSRTDLVRRD